MGLKTAAKFARRELRGGIKGFRIFLACLTLGVAAIAGVGSVKSAIQAGLSDQGAVLLGGDAEAQFTYRFATDEDRSWLESRSTALSEVTDFRSMVVVGEGDTAERGLTQVVRREVELSCNANNIPDKLQFDLIKSEIGDSIQISNIELPEGVMPTITDRDFVVATVVPPTVEVETKPTEAEEASEDDKSEDKKEDAKEESKEESK